MAENLSLFHEKFDREDTVKIGSEKSFGLTFGSVFFIVGVLPLFVGHSPRLWAIALGAVFFIGAVLKPEVFTIPNRLWFRLGLLLNRIISPLILGALFYLVFAPVGLVLRLFKKDILNLKIDRSLATYWIKSDSQISSMKDQF